MMSRVRINTSCWVTAGHRRRSVSFLPDTLTGRLNARDRDRDQSSISTGKKNGSGPHFVAGAGSARSVQKRSFGDYLELAMQSQYNKRNVWVLGLVSLFLYSRFGWVLLSSRGSKYTHTHNTHTQHTHTHTHNRHRRLWDWIDYLSIFRVKNEVSVAKIASIILSIFRVKTIDYRFRFLE